MRNLILVFFLFASLAGIAQTPVKISALPTATGNGNGGYLPMSKAGVTYKIMVDSLGTKIYVDSPIIATLLGDSAILLKLDTNQAHPKAMVNQYQLSQYAGGGGGGGSQTLQQTITAGNALTKEDTINLHNYPLYFIGDSLSRVVNTISGGYLGGGAALFIQKNYINMGVNDVSSGISHAPSFIINNDSAVIDVFRGDVGTPTSHFGMKYDHSYMDKPLYLKNSLGNAIQIDNGTAAPDAPFIRVADNSGNLSVQIQSNAIMFADSSGLWRQSFILNGNNYDNQGGILYTPVLSNNTIAVGVKLNGSTNYTDTLGVVDLGTISGGWGLTGNAGTSTGSNYMGTSDNNGLYIKSNAKTILELDGTTGKHNFYAGSTTGIREYLQNETTGSIKAWGVRDWATSTEYFRYSNQDGITVSDGGTEGLAMDGTNGTRINTGVGFGINTIPAKTLDINGTVRIRGNSVATGYVWTATNSSGDGVWAATSGGGTAVSGEEATGSTSSTITLAHTPIAGTYKLWKNGVRLPASEFSRSGVTVTLTSARLSGDLFQSDYNY